MKRANLSVLLLLFSLFNFSNAHAKIKAVTTVPDLAWALKAVGGEKVEVESLLSANEDPHFAMTLPSFIFKAKKADLLCFVGLELEIGWLPKIIEKSANPNIMKGAAGYCDTSSAITALEVHHTPVDRSMGDVHAAGNPHYTLSPYQMKKVLNFYQEKLRELEPENATYFKERTQTELSKLNELIEDSKSKLAAKKISQLMEYHKEYTYFLHDFNLSSAGSVEAIPGVPPSAAEILEVSKVIKNKHVALILAGPGANPKILDKLKAATGVNYLFHSSLMKEPTYEEHIKTLISEIISMSGATSVKGQ